MFATERPAGYSSEFIQECEFSVREAHRVVVDANDPGVAVDDKRTESLFRWLIHGLPRIHMVSTDLVRRNHNMKASGTQEPRGHRTSQFPLTCAQERYRVSMRRLIEWSRFVVAVPAVGSIIGAFVLMAVGFMDILRSLVKLFDTAIPLKESVVSILTAVDALLLSTVLLVIGYGLYELFVDSTVQLPAWLQITSLDDLKSKLIGVVVAIIAVVFVGILVEMTNARDVMFIGAGAGAVLLGLAVFTYASHK